ncbi:HD domain-containing protein [Chloroflexales bacterium ZM16-3]|nr:HD domain-containing protein [Chloroflexales bacterium ZM16-3]
MRLLHIEYELRSSLQEHHAATSTHCARVSHIATEIAIQLGLSDAEVRVLARAARLHDIGKIDVPSHLLIKTGQLTPDERALLDCHPDLGVARIACLIDDPTMIAVIGSHHERWDGSGYPRGLAGAQIPLAACIVAVADVYDALREARSYKPAWGHAEALSYLQSASGTKFAPAVVEAFAAAASGASSAITSIYTEETAAAFRLAA